MVCGRGDAALFARDGLLFTSGTVTYVVRNEKLANRLWERDAAGQTWEYTSTSWTRSIRRRSRTKASTLRSGTASTTSSGVQRPIRGAQRRWARSIQLDSPTYRESVSDEEFQQVVDELVLDPEEPLDTYGRVKLRKEQAKLRRALFGGYIQGRRNVVN